MSILKMRTYQNVRTQNAYLTRSAYSKCVRKRKVKVRLNRFKLWNIKLIWKFLRTNPDFSPFSQKRCLQSIDTWMSNRRDLWFQHRPHQNTFDSNQGMQDATFPYSKIFWSWKMTFASVLSFYWGMGWFFILLEGWSLNCFFTSSNAITKILLIYRSALILTYCSTKIRGDFQVL